MRRPVIVIAVGVVLALVGALVLVAAGNPGTGDFGWFAYTPLDSSNDVGILFVTRERVAGAIAMAVGLLVVTGTVGFTLGRRRTA